MRRRSYKRNAVLLGVALSLATPLGAQARDRHGRDDDRSTGKDSRGDCEGSKQCSDDDFSPSFDKSPVYLCLPTATCSWGGDEQGSS